MAFDDRLTWLLVGVLFGLVMGGVTETFREHREGVKEVIKSFKTNSSHKRNDRGAISRQRVNSVALFLVVVLVAFSAFKSQVASNKVEDTQAELSNTQAQLERVTTCNKTVLSDALNALNTRTSYTQKAAGSNLALVRAQSKMLSILLHRPPYSDLTRFEATKVYNSLAKKFFRDGTESQNTAKIVKYPDAEDLATCISDLKEDAKGK